jgi:hypothetical protein
MMTTMQSHLVEGEARRPSSGSGGTVVALRPVTPPGLGTVAWTRGHGCRDVARLLASGEPVPIGPNLARSCVEHRIDLLVTGRLSSFDLVPVVVPSHVDLGRVRTITAAVADGPHSPLVASVAARLAGTLRVPGELVTVYRRPEELPGAMQRIDRLGARHPELGRRVAQAPSAAGLTATLNSFNLLVLGAPGGSWPQRQLHGPGHRLADAAPGGAVVVRDAPRRCFHAAADAAGPAAVGPEMSAADARRLVTAPAVPVAAAGKLVGVLRAGALDDAMDESVVGDLMEPPVAVRDIEMLDAAAELVAFFEGAPVPVVDDQANLVGLVHHD